MSLWRPEAPIDLLIGASEWQVRRAGAVQAQASIGSLEDLTQSLALASPDRAWAGAPLHVAVHERWVRTFCVEPPDGLSSLAELQALSLARMEHLFGADGTAWRLDAQWSVDHPFVVTALPLPLIDAVKGLARTMQWRVRAVVADWVRAAATRPPPKGSQWMAVLQPGALTLALRRKSTFWYARSLRLPADAGTDALKALATREAARSGLDGPASDADWDWIDLREDPVSAHPRFSSLVEAHDGAGDRRWFALPTLRHAWPTCLALAALVALGASGGQQLLAFQGQRDALAQRAASLPAAPALTASVPQTRSLTPRAIDSLNAITHRLSTPWPDIFAALERSATRDVALLGVEPDWRQARLRGSGQAKDHRAMIDYVQGLSSQPPFAQARLTHHDLDEKDGARPLRFQFEFSMAARAADEARP